MAGADSTTISLATPTLSRPLWWLCLLYMGMALILYAVAFPVRYVQVLTMLQHVPALAVAQVAGEYIVVGISGLFGVFLVVRRQNDYIAMLTALIIVLVTPNLLGLSVLAGSVHDIFKLPGVLVLIGGPTLLYVWLLALPDGRIVLRWLRWGAPLLLAWDIARALVIFTADSADQPRLRAFSVTITIMLVAPAFIGMVYRYRRLAPVVQRQQFKWYFLGIYLATFNLLTSIVLRIVAQLSNDPQLSILVGLFTSLLVCVTAIYSRMLLFYAVTRQDLWGVDLTINRSIVTSIVSAILLFVFGGVFVLMQLIFRAILGEQHGEIAVAMAALVVGLAFNPVRLRARAFVDHRLYGLRFNLNQIERNQPTTDTLNAGALTGRTLGGYELLGVLGRGGMGEVYKGHADGKFAAIKILHDDQTVDAIARQRFEREGKIALAHPNIVQTYGFGNENGVFFVALEFVEGRTLKDLLLERGHLPFEEVLPVLANLADAVDTAHAQGYVHRDIKPANIMLRRNDHGGVEAVLMDFGIAKLLEGRVSGTGSGVAGTIDYMAPEQITNSRMVDHRADIYALGVVLFEVLTGAPPFHGTAGQVLFAHIQQPPPYICDVMPDIPHYIGDAIDRALAKDPTLRFSQARDFLDALQLVPV